MSLEFLSPTARGVLARSPMERSARAAGARFAERNGWNVAVYYDGETRVLATVGFADLSHLPKYELIGARPSAELGRDPLEGDRTWLPFTPTRALVIGGTQPDNAIDVTTNFGLLRLVGPQARETFARFTAIDLRPSVCRPGDWRPGSVARTPGGIYCEAQDRYLMLFGAALGQYVWTVVADAAGHLGGGPIGLEAAGA